MRSFMVTAAIAALASFPLTPGFAKSDPGRTASTGTHSTMSAGGTTANQPAQGNAGDSSDPPPYVTDPLRAQPTLRQWLDSLFDRNDRPH